MLDGWSKTYAMTGWRIGYGIWPNKYAKIAEQMNINSFSCTNTSPICCYCSIKGSQNSVEYMISEFDKGKNYD